MMSYDRMTIGGTKSEQEFRFFYLAINVNVILTCINGFDDDQQLLFLHCSSFVRNFLSKNESKCKQRMDLIRI